MARIVNRRSQQDPVEQVLAAWRTNARLTVMLLNAVPQKGFNAIPLASRGRTVGEVFAHLHKVRRGWVTYNDAKLGRTIPALAKLPKGVSHSRAALRKALTRSNAAVELLLRDSLHTGRRMKYFSGSPVRWMGYLISHDSHHRGQILLALKQNGMKLPEKIALTGLWGGWIFGSK